MLGALRQQGLKSVIYGVMIVATSMVFLIQFNPAGGKQLSSLSETCVAQVRGQCIDPKDHMAAYRLFVQQIGPANARKAGMRRLTADGLVERELLLNEAKRLGVTVTEHETTDAILKGRIYFSLPSTLPPGAFPPGMARGFLETNEFKDKKSKEFDYKTYQRALRAMFGRSETEFHEEQERELLAHKMRELVRAPVRVSESEAYEAFERERNSAVLSYIHVPSSFAGTFALDASDKAVASFLEDKTNADVVNATFESRKEADKPKAGQLRHIMVRFDGSMIDGAKAAALIKLSRAIGRVRGGDAFGEVARSESEDFGSSGKAGVIEVLDGFSARAKAAIEALKAGEVAKTLIEAKGGLHLFAKDDPAAESQVEAAAKKAIAREILTKTRGADKARELAASQIPCLQANKDPEECVKALMQPFAAKKIPVAPLPDVLFEEVAKANADDAGPSKVALTAADVAKALPKFLDAEGAADKPEVRTTNSFSGASDPIPGLDEDAMKKVVKFAFESKEGATFGEALSARDGAVVTRVKERKAATREDFEKEREVVMASLLEGKRNEGLAAYVKRLREASKDAIKIDENFVREISADAGAPAMDDSEE
jgi:peptidyl-prolyl cis-trans isomerase D